MALFITPVSVQVSRQLMMVTSVLSRRVPTEVLLGASSCSLLTATTHCYHPNDNSSLGRPFSHLPCSRHGKPEQRRPPDLSMHIWMQSVCSTGYLADIGEWLGGGDTHPPPINPSIRHQTELALSTGHPPLANPSGKASWGRPTGC